MHLKIGDVVDGTEETIGQNLAIALMVADAAASTYSYFHEDAGEFEHTELGQLVSANDSILHELRESSIQSKMGAIMTYSFALKILAADYREHTGLSEETIIESVARRLRIFLDREL